MVKFNWDDEKVFELINCIKDCKTLSEFKAIDFSYDKPALYEAVRKRMSAKYRTDFGPPEVGRDKGVNIYLNFEISIWRQC